MYEGGEGSTVVPPGAWECPLEPRSGCGWCMGRREASSGGGGLGGGLEREGAWWSARGGEGQVQGYIGHEVGSGLRLGERAGLALGRWGLEVKQEEEEEEEEGAHGGAAASGRVLPLV